MNHIRQQVREKVGTVLTGLTTTGSNVFQSRIYNVQESELPCLLIYTKAEDLQLDDGGLNFYKRVITVTVEGKAQATSSLDDTLDTISKEVEVAMSADITLGSLAVSHYLKSTQISLSGEGDQPIGSVVMDYEINCLTPYGDPTSVI